MRIVHACPFGPNRAGIYEAARDLARADTLHGHGVEFVDTGITTKTGREEPVIGGVDDRAGFKIVTASPKAFEFADVIVAHSGVPDNWVVKTQAPLVWILHGRPLASFLPEQAGGHKSYGLYAEVGAWPRTKAMVHFWPEFDPYWSVIIPQDKLFAREYPPIDRERFSPDGNKHLFKEHAGRLNGLICDSRREDVDVFEVVHGAIAAAREHPGLKWHIYAMETPLGPFEYLISALRSMNALGEVCARMPNMEEVYRAADVVLTPHRIVTRVIGEALACGTPVVAAQGCKVTPYTMTPADPQSVADAVTLCLADKKARDAALEMSLEFDLRRCDMTPIYERALGMEPAEESHPHQHRLLSVVGA